MIKLIIEKVLQTYITIGHTIHVIDRTLMNSNRYVYITAGNNSFKKRVLKIQTPLCL